MIEDIEKLDDIEAVFETALQKQDEQILTALVQQLPPAELARVIFAISKEDQLLLLEILGSEKIATIMTKISGLGSQVFLDNLSPDQSIPIIKLLPQDYQARLLRKIGGENAEIILDEIGPEESDKIRKRMSYPDTSAGALMITDYLAYPGHLKVGDVLDDLRQHGDKYSDYQIQYAYVVSESGKLIGVLRLRDLLMTSRAKTAGEIMVTDPLCVPATATLRDLKEFFSEHKFFGVPVVDETWNLVGVVRSEAVRETLNQNTNQIFLKFAGIVGGEELRSMPLIKRSSRRLSWLSINIVLNIVAASVIALYQDTLEKAIVLAVFLPIISDMSGCSGNQAVAVSIRELTLGLVRPRELLRVLGKEAAIGIVNGAILGALLGGVALLWKGNPYLGLVVGSALAANTFVAVGIGGLVPLILKGMRTDPALASGPLLTTITDMCGFFFVLSLASFLLPRLV